jgi:hypothetical protein
MMVSFRSGKCIKQAGAGELRMVTLIPFGLKTLANYPLAKAEEKWQFRWL